MQFSVWAVLLVSLAGSALTYTIPEPEVQLLNPRGVRISIPHDNGIVLVAYHLSINKQIALNQLGDYSAEIMKPANGKWAWDNTQAFVDPGDIVNYWVHVQHGNFGYRKLGSVTVQQGGGSVVTPRNPTEPTNPTKPSDCEPSITTVQRKPACKGALIFEDSFDSLDMTKWKHEIRIPVDEEDSEFVSFQGRPENCYVSGGELHIVSSLQFELPGFNESLIRSGTLDLGPRCTAKVDITNGCRRTAQRSQILPPIVSARIQTKDSFSFRYGKVEVRAKLPTGDWLFPLILMEPLENYYGFTGYASGQMRVAFNRGNAMLKDRSGVDISGRRLAGGVVLSSNEALRRTGLKESRQAQHLGDSFHTYVLTWTDKDIGLQVDGIDYALIEGPFADDYYKAGVQHAKLWENGNLMAPFDKEFFLTLGLSAGGHADFPDECLNGPDRRKKPWRNLDPKAELQFWNDRANWMTTWNEGLIVDYVKVYAL